MGIEYNEVQDGQLLKWDKPGTVVEGLLKTYTARPDTGKGPGHVYEVRTKNGVIAFFAPSLLHKKLREHVGEITKITYVKEGKTKIGNTLKEFNVGSAKATPENLKAIGVEVNYSSDEDEAETAEEVANSLKP